MCERLHELRGGLQDLLARFDAGTVLGSEAAAMLSDAAAMEAMASSLKARLALRIEECGAHRGSGQRSAAEFVAQRTGASTGSVIEAMRTASRLQALPEVDAAVKRGELSERQAAAVTDAARLAPDAQSRLLDVAKAESLKELQAECGRVKAAHVDLEARRQRIHRQRFVRSYEDSDGAAHMHAKGNPEAIALMMASVNAERDVIFEAARTSGDTESPEAYGFDALVKICTGTAEAKAPRHKVIVRVDLDALLRGWPENGEVCEVAGVPVAVSAVEEILGLGSTFLTAVITKAERLSGVLHRGRAPTAKQQTGLEWLYPTCAVAGCSASARLQRDHREDWADTHVTIFELLDLLCPFHHGLKTREGWRLVEGTGKREFVPPPSRAPAGGRAA